VLRRKMHGGNTVKDDELFSVVRNQHVRDIKCIAAGDPCYKWEMI
jgi:hypothetical protein